MLKKVIGTMISVGIISCIILGCGSMSTEAEETYNITIYSWDGRVQEIENTSVNEYIQPGSGWYYNPVQIVYAPDGKTLLCSVNSPSIDNLPIVAEQLTVGWFATEEEAAEARLQTVNNTDAILLARVINAEAANNITDRQYVGRVVVNRVHSGYWGSTLKSVIYAKGQYACVGNSKFNSYPPQECITIAKQCLSGETFGMPSNVIFQSQAKQGSGVWKKVGVHYYCYR